MTTQRERPNQEPRESEEAFAFREQQYWDGVEEVREKIRQVRENVEARFGTPRTRRRNVRLGL